jgi:5-hydroxyisourate hydrolase
VTPLSTHVLDLAGGAPVSGVAVALERFEGSEWARVEGVETDAAGRACLLGESPIAPGSYRLVFDARLYYRDREVTFSYGEIPVCFEVAEPQHSVHLPLLVAPYGYSTYKGT